MRKGLPIGQRWAAAVGAVLLLASSAFAGGSPIEPAQAREWLMRMHQAATQRNYQGTLVVTTGATMSSSRIAHYCEGSQTFERVDVLDGQPRRVLRHNDQVLTLWPAAKVARLEQREPVPSFPALPAGGEAPLFERYEMLAEGPGRVAGHEARVFLLRPRDGARFAQRLWAEQGSGLLLRADVIAPDGRVLETSAFSDLSIGGKAVKPEPVQAALKQLDGWQLHKSQPQRTDLEAEGWQVKPPAGFRKSSCVKRSFAGADERQAAADVLQAVFTDGLTHVSIFIEPHRPERHRQGAAALGATHTWMQPLGAFWVTVMGDVPMGTLKQFAAAIERSR
jgi:sigma-E factor negative regulatory protein RseB